MRLQDEYGVVLKCVLIIELIWVANMEKWEENHLSGQFSKGGTSTKQSGTGTTLVMSIGTGTGTGTPLLYFDQHSYCGHNLVISYPI